VIARLGILAVVLAGACRQQPPPAPLPTVEVPAPSLPVEPPWVATRAAVLVAVDSSRFAVADSILTAFVQAESGTADASEAAFWRAMLRADPRNPAFSPASARAALEEYVAWEGAQRRTDATIVLRLLTLSDSLRTALGSQRSATELRDRARDEELQRLRDELQRTQAELERIKRRLGPPKP
jgi:hypothetical protein